MTDQEIVRALHICGEDEPCETCPVQLDEDERVCVGALFKHAAAAIERLTAENAALREKVPQWISVEDRLPEWGQRVIATNGVFVGEAFRRVMDIWLRYDDGAARACIGDEVTHWMPLPGAPEEGGKHE